MARPVFISPSQGHCGISRHGKDADLVEFLSRPPKGTVVSSIQRRSLPRFSFYLALPRALWYRAPRPGCSSQSFLSRPPKGTVVSFFCLFFKFQYSFYLALPRALWYHSSRSRKIVQQVFISPSQGHCGIRPQSSSAIAEAFLSRPPKGTVVSAMGTTPITSCRFYLALPRALWYQGCRHRECARVVFISPSQGHCGIQIIGEDDSAERFLSRPPKGTVVSVVPNLLK